MNYNKIHNNIITKALNENRKKNNGVYYERHHIIPRCLGGSNDKSNLVLLTAREHFIVHYLLCKIHPGDFKLLSAFMKMGRINKDNQKRYINSRLYEVMRINWIYASKPIRKENALKQWANKTEDERKVIGKKLSDTKKNFSQEKLNNIKRKYQKTVKNRTKEQQQTISKQNSNKSKKYWTGLSEEEFKLRSKQNADRFKSYYSSLSEDEVNNIKLKRKNSLNKWRNNRSEEDKLKQSKKQSETLKQRYSERSDLEILIHKIKRSSYKYETNDGIFYSRSELRDHHNLTVDQFYCRFKYPEKYIGKWIKTKLSKEEKEKVIKDLLDKNNQ